MIPKDVFQGTPWNAEPTEEWNRPAYWEQYYHSLHKEEEAWRRHRVIHREVDLLIRMLTASGDLPQRSPPRQLLDAGCGITLIPHILASWGFHVTALDSCPAAIGEARKQQPNEQELACCIPIWEPCADSPGIHELVKDPVRSLQKLRSFQIRGGSITYKLGDWCTADLPHDSFHVIHCRNGLRCSTKHYWRQSLSRFRELLAPGGVLLLETVNAIGIQEEVEELLTECGFVTLLPKADRERYNKYVIATWPTG